jgi:putative DNA primase/helicase
MNFTQEQVQVLNDRSLSTTQAQAHGVLSVSKPADLPAGLPQLWAKLAYPLLLIPSNVDGAQQWQARPATPYVNDEGEEAKYIFAKGHKQGLIDRRPGSGPVMLVEGTFQSLAVAEYAPQDTAVFGMAGCYGWRHAGAAVDLSAVDGREVIVCLDADVKTNLNVWKAGEGLKAALFNQGAKDVKYLTLDDTNGKIGIDDVLGRLKPQYRASYLENALKHSLKVSVKKPTQKAVSDQKSKYVGENSKYFDDRGTNFKSATFSEDFRNAIPCALAPGYVISVYDKGGYQTDEHAIERALTQWFGDDFSKITESVAVKHIRSDLAINNVQLPEWLNEPLLNCKNGMVDLRTGELLPHDPKYLSTAQIPVEYDWRATAPKYDAWMASQAGTQTGTLEFYASLMLDPSKTASKAIFLYGPSRSGKSTFLRIMEAMAGRAGISRSALSMQELSESQFAAAELYGKMLNSCAELPSGHVNQISTFKKILGGDSLTGNRKYGKIFTFTNRASLVFSANAIPTVGEKSKAYIDRMAPFEFNNTYIGKSDQKIEDAILAELPGILNRWVSAWRQAYLTGVVPKLDSRALAKFEAGSDQVALFSNECVRVSEDKSCFMTLTQIHAAYSEWKGTQKGLLGKISFGEKFRGIYGDYVTGPTKNRGFYVTVLPEDAREYQESEVDYTVLPAVEEAADSGALDRVDEVLEQQPESASAPVESVTDAPVIVPEQVPDTKVRLGPPVPAVVVDWSVPWRQGLKALFSEHHRVIPRCPNGHKMSWVDGAWWACPVCHPKSVERP